RQREEEEDSDEEISHGDKRKRVDPGMLKDKSTNKSPHRHESDKRFSKQGRSILTSSEHAVAKAGKTVITKPNGPPAETKDGLKRVREDEDLARQPKDKKPKVVHIQPKPTDWARWMFPKKHTAPAPQAPKASVCPKPANEAKLGQHAIAAQKDVEGLKVSNKSSPVSRKPKLKLVMKKSTTTSPLGSTKNGDMITKAGHVTDRVSDFPSSGAKEAEIHIPPTSNKRPAELPLEKEDRKKLKISPEPPKRKPWAELIKAGRTNRGKPAGLRNYGNLCYYNAILQSLLQTLPIRQYCLAKGDSFKNPVTSDKVTLDDVNGFSRYATRRGTETRANLSGMFEEVELKDINMSGHVGRLFSTMYYETFDKGEKTHVSPLFCTQAYARLYPGFDGSLQQDPAEFLRQILERLSKEDRATGYLSSSEKSVVESSMEGEISQTLRCTNCMKYCPEKLDTFNVLSLALPERTSHKKPIWTLTQCLDELKKSKSITDFKCENCSTEDRKCFTMETSSVIKKAPDYLAMQVLRMACDVIRGTDGKVKECISRKLLDTVEYPETIDLRRWTSDRTAQVYELYSVVEHKGYSLDEGHCVAYVKSGDRWMYINDQRVQMWDSERVLKINPYLLFYRKKGLELTS
ncbi:MAG: Ubiquitin carboxyl-terminal hydrolase 21, partial [Pleopsidium flavum]